MILIYFNFNITSIVNVFMLSIEKKTKKQKQKKNMKSKNRHKSNKIHYQKLMSD